MTQTWAWKGVESVVLESGALRVVVLPSQGGHIASLRTASGRELLWQAPWETYRLARPGSSFSDGENAGMDDMFPNAAACRLSEGELAGRELPDHGELWTLPCSIERREDNLLVLSAQGQCLPYRIEKTISLTENSLRIQYYLENTGDVAFPFLWAAHPLFQAEHFERIEIPGYQGEVSLPYCFGKSKESGKLRYPEDQWDDGTLADLQKIPDKEPGVGYKYMTDTKADQGLCILRGKPGREDVRVTVPAETIPYMGVWVDACSDREAPVYVVAPEPSNHASVTMEKCPSILRPCERFTWWIQYTVENRGD